MEYKNVTSSIDNYEDLASQLWGVVLYFLGAMPEQEEYERNPYLQQTFHDLHTWMYHIQHLSKENKRLKGEHGTKGTN